MRELRKIFFCLLFLSAFASGARAQGNDVFVPIGKYLEQGDSEALSAWFADNLEIGILSKETNSSRNQARQIVKAFFEAHTPRSFSVTHTAGRAGLKYATGSLNAGGEVFAVTIFVSCKDEGTKIQQLKIER
jgi:hypothetical protein